MRTAVCLLLLIASAVSAFTDFHGLSGPHKRVELSDGTVHLSQDVHHKFEEHGTFFKATYSARHEAKWHFVELSTLIPDFTTKVKCSVQGESELTVMHPTEELLTALAKQNYVDTVITAHARHHCDGKGIFRKVISVDISTDRVVIKTAPTTYTSVFKELSVVMETNHVHTVDAPAAVTSDLLLTQHRGYSTQSIWGDITGACSSVVSGAENDLSDAASAVGSAVTTVANGVAAAASTVVNVVSGDYTADQTYNLPGASWNPDLTQNYNWDMVSSNVNLAASFDFQPTVTFKLDISDWSLNNVEAYFTGDLTAGVKGQFSATYTNSFSDNQQVTVINLSPISFMIGPVPVVLTPSIPINAGYTVNIDGSLSVGATVTANANVQYGFAYSPSTGHRTIQQDGYSYNYDFNPKTFSVAVGIKPFLQPILTVSIDYIGTVGVGAAIYANILVQSNNDCLFDLSINAQPVLSASASLGVSLAGHSIFSKSWGPYTLWSSTYPIYSYCMPNTIGGSGSTSGTPAGSAPAPTTGGSSAAAQPPAPASGSGSGASRRFSAQSTSQNVTVIALPPTTVVRPRVTRTIHKQLGPGFVGKVWQGRSVSCGATDMIYSLTYAIAGTGDNLVRLTLSQSRVPPTRKASHRGMASAIIQALYRNAGASPQLGVTAVYTLVNESSTMYKATTNSSILNIEVPASITLTFSPTDTRFVAMNSGVTCGAVTLAAPEANNDNRTFTLLGAAALSGGNAAISTSSGASSSTPLVAVAAVAGCAALVAIVLAGVLYSRRTVTRKAVPTSEPVEHQGENLTSLMLQEDRNAEAKQQQQTDEHSEA
jgi:hypothetical protein